MAQVTLKGNPIDVAGNELKVGDAAPEQHSKPQPPGPDPSHARPSSIPRECRLWPAPVLVVPPTYRPPAQERARRFWACCLKSATAPPISSR